MRSNTTRLPDRVKASLWAGSLGALAVGGAVLGASLSSPALAENIRGAATGPTTAPGFSHPEQYIHLKDVKPADNMYPVIQHPEQDKAARDKLAALEEKTGKKPNILIFLLDDVGWMDPGFNGGGVAVGNATPDDGQARRTRACCSPRPIRRRPARPPAPPSTPGRTRSITASCARRCTASRAVSTAPSPCRCCSRSQGYVTQGVGKWHMGENQGSLPQNVGYRRLCRLPRRVRHVHRVARHLLQSRGRAVAGALQDARERRLRSLRGALHAGRQDQMRERQADRARLHQGARPALAGLRASPSSTR